MPAAWRFSLVLLAFSLPAAAQTYSAPAGIRPALRGPVGTPASSILPGGRIITPLGEQHPTGSGPFGLAVSASGKTVVTSNGGPGRNSLTVMERGKGGGWEVGNLVARSDDTVDTLDEFAALDWRGVFMGLALSGEHAVYVSEGNSGRIGLFDWSSARRRVINLNQDGFNDSYTGDLAFDAERNILYAVDQANFRVAVIDARSLRVLASVRPRVRAARTAKARPRVERAVRTVVGPLRARKPLSAVLRSSRALRRRNGQDAAPARPRGRTARCLRR